MLGMSWELNVIGSDGNNYGPTGFEITGSGVPAGNDTFEISTSTGGNESICSITFNADQLVSILDTGGTIPNPFTFTIRATDDGGEFVQGSWTYEFDFNSCRTWTVTLPQEAAQDYIINTFECAGTYSSCALLDQTFTSSPVGVTQFNFCSKANCPDPTPKAGSPVPTSISKAPGGLNPCLPTP